MSPWFCAVAMAAVFLAAKVEENARRASDVINVFTLLASRRRGSGPSLLDQPSPAYESTKAALCATEAVILKELGFDMYALTSHPHKLLLLFGELLRAPHEVVQAAWNHVNDSFRLDVCVRVPPETVACAGLLLAATNAGMGLPQSPPWHALLAPATAKEDLYAIADEIRSLYVTEAAAWLPSLRPIAD